MTHYSKAALGQVVRGLREHRGMTQEELGRKAGYRAGAGVSISRLESGLLRPGSDRVAGLAAALGLTLDDLETRASTQTAEDVATAQAAGGVTGSTEGGPVVGMARSPDSASPK